MRVTCLQVKRSHPWAGEVHGENMNCCKAVYNTLHYCGRLLVVKQVKVEWSRAFSSTPSQEGVTHKLSLVNICISSPGRSIGKQERAFSRQ